MVKKSILIILLFFVFIILACFNSSNDNNSKDKKYIKIAYVNWIGESSATNVVKVVLEKIGYQVDILPVTTAIMYQYLATGKVDGMVASWIPTADRFYYNKLKDKFIDLGPNYEGTIQGFVVPSYVPIDTISELKGHGSKFNNKMVGIDAGAGTQLATEHTLIHYGLNKEYDLISSSEAVMLSSLDTAIKRKEWILVPLWKPHWAFSRYSIKFLKDPDLLMGDSESVHTLVRLGLDMDDPVSYYVFDNFKWDDSLILPLIDKNEKEPGKEYSNAKEFVKNNKDIVKTWVPEEYRNLFD